MLDTTEPRILVIDIETKLIDLRAFGIRDQYLDIKQIVDIPRSARGIHCIGIKWLGQRKTTVLSEWGARLSGDDRRRSRRA